ncbi:hypothetical protein [Shouchella clausii]|uniref:hypothetical protein n=1 Tax=Shouchella clausii TaxID=79880 RepID=UPI000BA5C16B|nr:hypothetical protein [Shouchella clausii]PAD91658.1 hypothetical protein CHH52_13630 [Shouchella clausii]
MKRYNVSDHAIKRATERLRVKRSQAVGYLNQLMQTAVYIGDRTNEDGSIVAAYYHENSRTEIRVSTDGKDIVTCMKKPRLVGTIEAKLPTPLLAAVKREAAKLLRNHGRELRRLERELAEAELLLAQKRLNRLKTNNPRTKAAIDRDIKDISSKIDANKTSIGDIEAAISQLKAHA